MYENKGNVKVRFQSELRYSGIRNKSFRLITVLKECMDDKGERFKRFRK